MKLIISFAVCFSITISKASTQTKLVGFPNSQQLENDWPLRQSKSVFSDDDTTTTPVPPITYKLDIMNDTAGLWLNSSLSLYNGWFEYYEDKEDLKSNGKDQSLCAGHSIKDSVDQLNDVKGIWIACQDQQLPEDCGGAVSTSLCYPILSFNDGFHNPLFKTVKISISLRGMATVRLTLGDAMCFDFSLRKDPFSRCEYINPTSGNNNNWVEVQSAFDGYSPILFRRLTVQLIARFKEDVALVDWIYVTSDRLCDGEVCTTTPTPSTTPTTTPPPPPTNATTEASSDYDDYEDETTTVKEINSSDSISVLKICIFLSLITNLVSAIMF